MIDDKVLNAGYNKDALKAIITESDDRTQEFLERLNIAYEARTSKISWCAKLQHPDGK